MNKNITLSVPEPLLRTVRKIASSKSMTVNGLVRRYLEDIARPNTEELSATEIKMRDRQIDALLKTLSPREVKVGPKPNRTRTYEGSRFH
ncbi:MAG: hypothetical protein SFY92_12860 [Verrucomicrobiae bacterium]|nr:hypothetical protein [Verrucomicrobiae bacterium]